MPKQRQPEEQRRRESILRRIRHPWHLQELEAAAQTDVDPGPAEGAGQPMDDEAHRGIAFGTNSGAFAGHDADSGLSVDPEDLGLQFLRDATEQDNFESEFQSEAPTTPDRPPLDELDVEITEESLLADGQEETETFLGPAAGGPPGEYERLIVADVDMLSNVIHEASLFDATTEQNETLSPRIESDESEVLPADIEARAREQERERKALRRLRFAKPSARGRSSRR